MSESETGRPDRKRICYLMVRDVDGGIEFAADFGLQPPEVIPEDVEQMTEAQYTIWKFVAVLRGINDPEALKEAAKERPTGLLVPGR